MDKEDTLIWKDGETKEFTIKFAYKILKEDAHGEEGDLYVGFWKIKAQPLALATVWRVLEDKISSRANLTRRGIKMDSCICCLCGGGRGNHVSPLLHMQSCLASMVQVL